MNCKKVLTVVCCIMMMMTSTWASEVFFANTPCLSPDAKTVVFSYNGNLWRVSAEGGEPSQVTSMEGIENYPRISPDGKWLAFSARQDGNANVYVMPLAGGAIRQLTYHEAGDQVSSWSWDSEAIYFTSSRLNGMSTYMVALNGGTPVAVSDHVFAREHNVVPHPDGRLFFNETWESSKFLTRKKYKGAFNPDIKSYHLETKEYQEYTSYKGKDVQATIDRTGNIYFSSDRDNEELNLFQLEGKTAKRLTDFDESIYHIQVSADGRKIVFVKGYQLWIYDVATKQASPLAMTIHTNNVLSKSQDFNTAGHVTAYDVSSDAKKLAFVSRGELFVSDIKGKFVKQLATNAQGRVNEVFWLKDDKQLLFSQTVDGYQNWFTIKAKGSGVEKQITFDKANNRNLAINSKKDKAVYLSGREEVRLLNLKTMKSTLLTKQELWGFYSGTPSWASDDCHVVFSAYNNFESDIYLLDTKTKEVKNLTQSGVSENGATIDGKYVYFLSDRTQPSYPRGAKDVKLYRMALTKQEQAFRADKFDALFEGRKKDKKKNSKLEVGDGDLMKRLERMSPRFGTCMSYYVFEKEGTTTILFVSDKEDGELALYKKVVVPFEKDKTEKIASVEDAYDLSLKAVGDKYYILENGNIHELKLSANKLSKIAIQHTFTRTYKDEFEQMFDELWANVEENFYNESFHGIDWKAMKKRYRGYLKHVQSRSDLRRLLNDMLGELNTSHVGFYSNGKEETIFYKNRTSEVGLLFDTENPYKVRHIITDSPADIHAKNIQVGDVLVAVNGVKLNPQENRNRYFTTPSMQKELQLTFFRKGKNHTVNFHTISSAKQKDLLYDEWQDECQARVDKLSNGRIAHVHMKDMTAPELELFLEEMVTEANNKEALILDLRNNRGGNVHDDVLQFLSQRPYLKWQYREGKRSPQPHFAPSGKPMVLLINEQSLSDAEMTSAGFKELGLGKIIGEETYRWIIFTSAKRLVDGSGYRLPSWGCYTLDGVNLELNGVSPDIRVRNTFEHRMKGQDPQLERAVQEVLKDLK